MPMYRTKDILRLERIKRGWTQEDVAKMLNMARASYAQYETGACTPTTDNLIRLAKLYNLSVDYLLFGMSFMEMTKRSMQDGEEFGDQLADRILEGVERKRVRKKKKSV